MTTSPKLPLPLLASFLLLVLSLSQPQVIPNPRLQRAYVALQALKHAITSDPKNLTGDWCGPHVCNYTGVFCAPDPVHHELTVAGLDLNHGDIAGRLPEALPLGLPDLALLHLNSNRFRGPLPGSLAGLPLLYELDLSSNLLEGPFPSVLLRLGPSLRYLDIRFNRFCGGLPPALFDMRLDALFLNDNNFSSPLPPNLGNSPASVLVLANTALGGCLPASIGKMGGTLDELVVLNAGLRGCLPPEVGLLKRLRVFDVSFNGLVGPLPETMGAMERLEQLDVAHNGLSGEVPAGVCGLPRLKNFTYSYNYFCGEPQRCLKVRRTDDRRNCIPRRPDQRPPRECEDFLRLPPVRCPGHGCSIDSLI